MRRMNNQICIRYISATKWSMFIQKVKTFWIIINMHAELNSYLSCQTPSPEQSPVTCVGWNRITGLFACGHKNGFITLASIEEDSEHPGISRINIKTTIPEHRCEITSLVWNEKYQILITADISGLLLIWYERDGKWIQLKRGERSGFRISSIACSRTGEYVAVAYENGLIICGTKDVQISWTAELSHSITSISFDSHAEKLYVGTSQSILYSISDQGNTIKIINFNEKLKDDENSSIVCVSSNYKSSNILLIAFQNGQIILFDSNKEETLNVFDSQMILTSAAWSKDGQILAVAGRPHNCNQYRILFYSEKGILVHSLNLATLNISSIHFDSGYRLLTGIGNSIGVASLLKIYPYHYFKNTLVYSFPSSIPDEFNIIFFNHHTEGRHLKKIHKLIGIAGTPNNAAIGSLTKDNETALIICNEYGVPITESICNFSASLLSFSESFIAAASDHNLYLWNYKTHETKGFTFKQVITSISLQSKLLFISFDSKELVSYLIPSFEEHSRYNIPFIVQKLDLASDETRISMIDVHGNMVFLDIHSGTATKSTRNETWCMKWSEDSPNYLVSLEKQRLYVYRNFKPEESIVSLTHVLQYKGLVVNTVNFIGLFKDPLNPTKANFYQFDSKPLRDLKLLLRTNVSRDEIISYVKEKDHPTLWQILAESCLQTNDLYNAEKAFEQANNKASHLFIKTLSTFPKNSDLQNGLIAWYLQDYRKAESLLLQADRTDLVLEMLNSIRDWTRILEIADPSETELRNRAHLMIAQEEEEKENWEIAADHYRQANDLEQSANSLFNGRLYDKVGELVKHIDDPDLLTKIGHKYTLLGDIDRSINIFLGFDNVNGAIESCISMNEWKKALKLSEKYPKYDKKHLLTRFATYLVNHSHVSLALHYLVANNLYAEASKIIANEGNIAFSQRNYVFAKKCFCFAAQNEMQANINPVQLWHQCEAIHFLLMANNAIFKKKWGESIELASRLFSDYSDVIGKETTSAILAIIGINSNFYKQASLAFIHLENSKKLSKRKKEKFEKMAIKIFAKVSPVDPSDCKSFNCPKCNREMIYPQVKCRCGYVTQPSVVSGNSVDVKTAWKCSTCLHFASNEEISDYTVCPLCHSKV